MPSTKAATLVISSTIIKINIDQINVSLDKSPAPHFTEISVDQFWILMGSVIIRKGVNKVLRFQAPDVASLRSSSTLRYTASTSHKPVVAHYMGKR